MDCVIQTRLEYDKDDTNVIKAEVECIVHHWKENTMFLEKDVLGASDENLIELWNNQKVEEHKKTL